MFHALDHVIIAVRDLDAATAEYSAFLGRLPSWRGEHPGLGTANTLFRLGNTYLELLSPQSEGPFASALREWIEREGEGTYGLALGTDDAEACLKELQAQGLDARGPQEGEGRDLGSDAVRKWRSVTLPASDTRGLTVFAIEHLSPPEALPLAQVEGSERAAIAGLDHVVVRTADPDASVTFWGERMGIRLALDRSFPERGVRLIFFRVGGATIELAGRLGVPPDSDARDGFGGLAYQVPDVRAACARVGAAGFDVSEVRSGNKPGTAVCTVRDRTCGVPTLLIGPD